MQGFKLDNKGDVIIENSSIALVSDNELKAQTLRTVMGTNKGEWFLNENEGISFRSLLGKGVTDEMRRLQCESACAQVDSSMYITDFTNEVDNKLRHSNIYFRAQNGNGESITYSEDQTSETNANASVKLAEANATLAKQNAQTSRLENRLDGIL